LDGGPDGTGAFWAITGAAAVVAPTPDAGIGYRICEFEPGA
jgi:hypothetical protein